VAKDGTKAEAAGRTNNNNNNNTKKLAALMLKHEAPVCGVVGRGRCIVVA